MLKLISAFDVNFESVQEYYNSIKNKEDNCKAINLVPQGIFVYQSFLSFDSTLLYYLVNDDNPGYILGFGTIFNSKMIDFHNRFDLGHIGYSIRDDERNKHYGTFLLALLLEKCQELNMEEVCISCLKDNIASLLIIKNNSGVLDKEFFDIYTQKEALKFWIKLQPQKKKILNRRKDGEKYERL